VAKGNTIIVSAIPNFKLKEGIIGDTSLPGTIMRISPAVEPVSGRFTWTKIVPAVNAAPSLIAVLLEDYLQGKTISDAYVANRRGFLYCPQPGDEMNVLIGTSGTPTFAIGDYLSLELTTGNLIARPTTASVAVFQVLETLTAVAAPYLAWCMFCG
jgi:hypothetical protein